ncbi:enhanced intracellular survival protein Eis [Plantactinospora siamensis]|uniref:Enhanced intracellular survival protein Eis n=1 Tax=Plantactinospora siamensis TaxID=555372 RepID=A0ABV6P0Z7_9ACTN
MRDAIEVRELAESELEPAWRLGRLAFGGPPDAPPSALKPAAGFTRWGAFDAAGTLLGKATDLHYGQWWGGRPVPSADIGGVAVLPEARGRGVARALLTGLLRGARERGAAVSALYPTVVAPYRAAGWEVCGVLRSVDLATAALPRERPTGSITVRPGAAGDLPEVRRRYDEYARRRCGLLTRRGGWYGEDWTANLLADADGLTVAEEDGRLVGYLVWQRGRGYGADSVLTVEDIVAETPAAARALVGVLSSWVSVAPTLRLPAPEFDAVTAWLPLATARDHSRQPWMHRPVDVVRAVAERGWPAHVRGAVEFGLTDPVAPWNTGAWRLDIADGRGSLTPAGDRRDPGLVLTPAGFGLLYCAAAGAATLLEAGLLRASAGADPTALDLLACGPRAQLLDYF